MTEELKLPFFGDVSPIRRVSITQPSFVKKPNRSKPLQSSDPTLAKSAGNRHVGFATGLPQIRFTSGVSTRLDVASSDEDIGPTESQMLIKRGRARAKSMAVERMPSVQHGGRKRGSIFGGDGMRRSRRYRRKSVMVNQEDLVKLQERELMREAMNYHVHRGPDWPEGYVGHHFIS